MRGLTGGAAGEQRSAPGGWVDADERETWLSLMRVMVKLPPLLDAQLERSAGLNFFEDPLLSMLSEQEDRALQMGRLAEPRV